MNWNFNTALAPRDGTSKVVIAVRGSNKVRWCVWNKLDRRWSGLLPGEEPEAFCVATHPRPKLSLPKGMKL